jgi:hypothetical protein
MIPCIATVVQLWPICILEDNLGSLVNVLVQLIEGGSDVPKMAANTLRSLFKQNDIFPPDITTLIQDLPTLPDASRLKFREAKAEEKRVKFVLGPPHDAAQQIREMVKAVTKSSVDEEPEDESRAERDRRRGVTLPKGVRLRKSKPWFTPYKYERPPKRSGGTFLQRNAPPRMPAAESQHVPHDRKLKLADKFKAAEKGQETDMRGPKAARRGYTGATSRR